MMPEIPETSEIIPEIVLMHVLIDHVLLKLLLHEDLVLLQIPLHLSESRVTTTKRLRELLLFYTTTRILVFEIPSSQTPAN